jgi:hypothetical protein
VNNGISNKVPSHHTSSEVLIAHHHHLLCNMVNKGISNKVLSHHRRGDTTLRGQVGGGWALEIKTFLGPVKWHRANRGVPFGPEKSRFPGLNPLPLS